MTHRDGGNDPATPASFQQKDAMTRLEFAMTHREGGNDPATLASVLAQRRHNTSGGWK